MSAQLTDEEALNRVASYCSAAEHCRAEVNEKLQRVSLNGWKPKSILMTNAFVVLL